MKPIPEDPNKVKDIVARLRAVEGKNNPKGLPKNPTNVTHTDADFPLTNVLPKDPGWMGTRMITGSGYGPELGTTGMM